MKEIHCFPIDDKIDIDLSKLPKTIVDMIKELEELNAKDDWFMYDIKFDILENFAKGYVITSRNTCIRI